MTGDGPDGLDVGSSEAAEWRPTIVVWVLCGACQGARTEGDAMCPACGGEGRIEVREDSASPE